MTNKEIQAIYKKQRHAFAQRKYYYKKKYGIELVAPKTVKKPTEKTLEKYAKEVYKQTTKAKKKIKRKKTIPTAESILLNRIKSIIKEGLSSDKSFENYKADKVNSLIYENLPKQKQARIKTLQEWEKALPDLDKAIETFIFDSSQTDTVTKNHSVVLWNTISSVLLGNKPVFTEVYEDIEDDEF